MYSRASLLVFPLLPDRRAEVFNTFQYLLAHVAYLVVCGLLFLSPTPAGERQGTIRRALPYREEGNLFPFRFEETREGRPVRETPRRVAGVSYYHGMQVRWTALMEGHSSRDAFETAQSTNFSGER